MKRLLRTWPYVVSLLLHGTAVAALMWRVEEEEPLGAKSAGTGGLEVALGPLGGAAGSLAPTMPAVREAALVQPAEVKPVSDVTPLTQPQPVEEVKARQEPEEATPRRVEVAEAQPVKPAEAQPIEPTPTISEVEPLQQVTAREPEAVTETKPRDVKPVQERQEQKPIREVVETKPVEPETVQAHELRPPPPKPRPRPQVAQVQPQKAPAQVETPSPAPAAPVTEPAGETPAVQGAEGRAGARGGRDTSSENSQAAGGLPGAPGDYLALLQAWLAKHKEYPRQAQMRRQEGTVLLHFVMDRGGRVLSFRVTRSSGYPMLDQEVEAMIKRAQPLPAMPDDMPQDRLELVVPVRFQLK